MIGGSAKVVKNAVAPASRKGSFFLISGNDLNNDFQKAGHLLVFFLC